MTATKQASQKPPGKTRAKEEKPKAHNGQGTVYERPNGKYQTQVTVGRRPDGRPDRVTITANTEREALVRRAQLIADHSRGILASPDKVTVAEWLERWLDGQEAHLAPKTIELYRGVVRLHVIPTVGRHRLQDLKPVHVRSLYTALARKEIVRTDARGDETERRPLAPSTQGKAAKYLKAALREAVQLELIHRNPAEAVQHNLAATERKAQAYEPAEVTALIETARSHPLYADLYPVFYTLLNLGLRRGECLGLRWSDVDLGARPIMRVRQALTKGPGGPALGKLKTPSARRVLYVPTDLAAVLEAHRVVQDAEREPLRLPRTPEDLVFASADGSRVHPDRLSRAMARIAEEAGVRLLRLHDLRHTYASLALRRGVPLEVVSRNLGHAKPSFTADTYRHLYDAERQEAALSLGELLGASRPVVRVRARVVVRRAARAESRA